MPKNLLYTCSDFISRRFSGDSGILYWPITLVFIALTSGIQIAAGVWEERHDLKNWRIVEWVELVYLVAVLGGLLLSIQYWFETGNILPLIWVFLFYLFAPMLCFFLFVGFIWSILLLLDEELE